MCTKLLLSLALLTIATRPCGAQDADALLLKNYRPRSIYNIPVSKVPKARYPVVDMHTHAYAKTGQELAQWVKTMDQAGIEKAIILSYATGVAFDSIYAAYKKYPRRFDVWCGFDYTGKDQPGWSEKAVRELER